MSVPGPWAGPVARGSSPVVPRFLGALLLGFLVWVPAASAQPVLVRSGEHPGFSRLALVLSPPRAWSLARDGDAHVLRIPGVAGFDVTQVFRLIPRDRLRDLAVLPDGQGVRLDLACDCPLRAFEDRPGVVVIDILDAGGAAPDPARAGPRPAPRPLVPVEAQASPADEWPVQPPAGGALGAWLGAGLGPVAPPHAAPEDALPDPAVDFRLASAREQLAAQIARAASQNMLSMPSPSAVGAPEPSRGAVGGDAEAPRASASLGLSVVTAADRDLGDARSRRTGTGVACIAGDRLDIGSWSDGVAGWDMIARQRGALLGEFDSPRPNAVQALVRGYLHLGLGAEAGAVLRAFQGQVEDEALLALLARLVDGGVAPDTDLAGMAECGGPATLWAVLASDVLPMRADLDRAGLLLGFSALPAHLRRQLGPRLSERFLDAGDAATAMTLRDAILRTPEGGGPATALLDARLALETGMPDVAQGLLMPLANSGRPEAPEAAILLVEALLSGGQPAPEPLRDTLAALAFEHRGTGLGIRLEAALAEADASSGRFAAAFARKARIDPDLPDTAAAALNMRLLALLVERAPDDAFLYHALPAAGWRGGATPAALRRDLARRFLDLGLPGEAIAAMTSGSRAPEAERLLRAEALIELGDAVAALPQLTGIAGPEAARLRARALEAEADPAAAASALAAAGLPAEAADLAWRSGDPALIARFGTDTQIAVAVSGAAMPSAIPGQGFGEPSAMTGVPADPTGEAPAPPSAEPAAAGVAPVSADRTSPPPATAAGGEPEAPSLARARSLLAAGDELRGDIAALLAAHPEP